MKTALRQIDSQSLVVGFIYLDNYDEALESVEDVRRSLLIALIDRKVNKYIASLDGIVRKTEKDKYLVILKKEALLAMKEARFDILEEIKTVNIGNEMAVTASIGMVWILLLIRRTVSMQEQQSTLHLGEAETRL